MIMIRDLYVGPLHHNIFLGLSWVMHKCISALFIMPLRCRCREARIQCISQHIQYHLYHLRLEEWDKGPGEKVGVWLQSNLEKM